MNKSEEDFGAAIDKILSHLFLPYSTNSPIFCPSHLNPSKNKQLFQACRRSTHVCCTDDPQLCQKFSEGTDGHKGQADPFASEHLTNSFHRTRRPDCYAALCTAHSADDKEPDCPVNLYQPALISYGSSILVITLALYLALDSECRRRIVMQSDSTGLNFRQRVRVRLKPR